MEVESYEGEELVQRQKMLEKQIKQEVLGCSPQGNRDEEGFGNEIILVNSMG